ncbi:MAG: RNA-protein complex protein Nop10 [Methanospirillaceae archaeon]|nr:RNA-protein complex protein Nop10 [Methanospirillaceae archaeon]
MKGRIRRCNRDNIYTLLEKCPICDMPTVTPHPFRFSPADTYHTYRRRVR